MFPHARVGRAEEGLKDQRLFFRGHGGAGGGHRQDHVPVFRVGFQGHPVAGGGVHAGVFQQGIQHPLGPGGVRPDGGQVGRQADFQAQIRLLQGPLVFPQHLVNQEVGVHGLVIHLERGGFDFPQQGKPLQQAVHTGHVGQDGVQDFPLLVREFAQHPLLHEFAVPPDGREGQAQFVHHHVEKSLPAGNGHGGQSRAVTLQHGQVAPFGGPQVQGASGVQREPPGPGAGGRPGHPGKPAGQRRARFRAGYRGKLGMVFHDAAFGVQSGPGGLQGVQDVHAGICFVHCQPPRQRSILSV